MNNKIRPLLLFGVFITSFVALNAQFTYAPTMKAYLDRLSIQNNNNNTNSLIVDGIKAVERYIPAANGMQSEGGDEFCRHLRYLLSHEPNPTTYFDLSIALISIFFYELSFFEITPFKDKVEAFAFVSTPLSTMIPEILNWKEQNGNVSLHNIPAQLDYALKAFNHLTDIKDEGSFIYKNMSPDFLNRITVKSVGKNLTLVTIKHN